MSALLFVLVVSVLQGAARGRPATNLRGSSMDFEPVDGGEGRACRGAHENDNRLSYFQVYLGLSSLASCKEKCMDEAACTGVEYAKATGRCEVWTTPIQASKLFSRSACYRRASISTTPMLIKGTFEPIDGGEGRACRGAHKNDNRRSYFKVHTGIPSLDSCKQVCTAEVGCTGIEYARGGRCEVWTRSVQSSKPLTGFACYSYSPASTTTTAKLPDACHTLLEGEDCYTKVLWAMVHGIYDFPQWYPAPLSPASDFEAFQAHLHDLYPDECPKPCAPYIPSLQAVPCESRAVVLDFFSSELAHNNLAGQGPDNGTENIRYANVGHMNGRPFDLVLTASDNYRHWYPRNGLAGKFGIINLRQDIAVQVDFAFEDSQSGDAVFLEAFHFSIFDVDQGYQSEERLYMSGFEKYILSEGSEIAVRDNATADGSTLFKSTALGHGCDNPRDPLMLDQPVRCDKSKQQVDMRKRAVTFLFANRSNFTATFEFTCKKAKCAGRNFLFAGSSTLSHSCKEAVKPGLCATFGDPHFVTFDGAHTVFMGQRVIWLVRSANVSVQAMSTDSDGKLEGLAVGGSFMDHHILIVRKMTPWKVSAFLDGDLILDEPSSEHHLSGVMNAFRSTSWNSTLHNEDILGVRTQIQFSTGPWPERFLDSPPGGLYLFKLPSGVEIAVTGADVMTVVITMPWQPGGQSGYCGNFNGDASDDFVAVGPSFHLPQGDDLGPVSISEALFDGSHWPAPISNETWSTPETIISKCDPNMMALARSRCQKVADARMNQDCVVDVCALGNETAAEGILAAEIVETKVNARGIPLFMGRGQCLDVLGQTYQAFGTGLASLEDCKDVLRNLALTPGVIGAQLQTGGLCQVLVSQGTDPTDVPIQGGWGQLMNSSAKGNGMITSVTKEDDTWIWQCWLLV